MSYAETYPARAHTKRLKRKHTLEQRVRSWGSVFNHRTMFPEQYRPKFVFPTFTPKVEYGRRMGMFRRFINWIKNIFV